jgi:D-sedoheptulose 7-phosphate isomerase
MRYQKKHISPKQFYVDYNNKLSNVLKNKHFIELENITKTIEKKIKLKKNIFVCGNGGSASVSNHFLCDFNKGIKLSSNKKLFPKVISLVNSIDLITAISNDLSYSEIFSSQLENYGVSGDVLIVISCSGSSDNIIKAIKFAKKRKLDIISLIGFGSNKFIKKSSEHYINLKTKNYGLTEDIFQAMMHMISQYLRKKYSKNKLEIL